MLLSVNENSERESNPMPQPLFLFGSAFLVSFTDPNKQLFNVKSIFKCSNHGLGMYEIYTFIIFLGMEILIIKQRPLKLMSDNR